MSRVVIAVLVVASAGCHRADTLDSRFDQIVERIRARHLEPGRVHRLKVDDDLEPSSLAPIPEGTMFGRGDGRGRIRAYVTSDHRLAVSIETEDNGHAGEFGYMYTDRGIPDSELEGTRLDSQHEDRIDARWVRWSYDLD